MNLASLSSSDFKRIAKLLAQKEALLAKVEKIDQELSAFGSDSDKPGKAAKRAKASRAGGKRGQLKDAIIGILKAAGAEGITVKEIATKVKRPTTNVFAWFFATGKKLKAVKKVGEAKYAWKE